MKRNLIGACVIGALPFCLASAAAWGDGVDITITNDGIEDIMVTVYDLSVGPTAVVLAHARLNGFTSIPLSVSPDDTGHANLAWTAISADANDRKCGHEENMGLGNASSLSVHADSTCKASAVGERPLASN